MENIRIGIIAEDSDYAMALASGITEIRRDLIVDILPAVKMTEGEGKNPGTGSENGSKAGKGQYMSSGKDQDLLLIEEQFVEGPQSARSGAAEDPAGRGAVFPQNTGTKTVILCRDREKQCMDRERGIYRLWRYSNIRDIVSSIIYIYTLIYDRHIPHVEKENVRFYGFFSHSGGTGCTALAMGTAQELRRFHGRKVMYVSMEQINSASEYMKNVSDGRTIAEYLYHCLGRKKDVWHMEEAPVESFLSRSESGVESFAASPGRNPVPYLDREDIPAFFSSIVKSGRYDTVVLDAGSSLAVQVTDALDICDSCCFVRDPARTGRRAELYADHVFSVLGPGLADHMVIADNRRTSQKEDERSMILDELFSRDEEDDDETDKNKAEHGGHEKEKNMTERGASDREGTGAGHIFSGNDEPGPVRRTADVIIDRDPSSFRRENGKIRILPDRTFGVRIRELTEKLIAAAGNS